MSGYGSILACSLVLVVIVNVCFATRPDCNRNNLLTCLTPANGYISGQGGKDLTQLKHGGLLTEAQVDGLCRIGSTTIDCLKDYVDQCVPRSVPEIHDFMHRTKNRLQAACSSPKLHDRTKVLMQCNANLSAAGAKFHTCVRTLANKFIESTGGSQGSSLNFARYTDASVDALAAWKNGNVRRNVCCNWREFRRCLETETATETEFGDFTTEVAKRCDKEAAYMDLEVYRAVIRAYSCNEITSNHCPLRIGEMPELFVFRFDDSVDFS